MTHDEFKKELNKPLPWYKRIYYFFYRLGSEINTTPRYIKWWFQKVFRGYGDNDLWNLDHSLSKHIHKCLVAFKKAGKTGVATYLIDDSATNNESALERGEKKQNRIIDEMIEGWEYLANQDDYEMELFEKYEKAGKKLDHEYFNINTKRYEDAQKKAKLLVEHICILWD